ncbi:MAG: class I SAM-dependent methyltransferase [Gemmataceae bacterium]|nr:class I SAM-dependent methyltransferase [Gemmataceae bacterium]
MNQTERVRSFYNDIAPQYDRWVGYFEKVLVGAGRRWACAQAAGEVLEVAIGTGRNLVFYPEEVRLTGIDLSPAMLVIARQRAGELGRQADLRVGDAQALDFADARFDSVVCTLALCCIPDDRKAVAEMQRVLRPGGRLVLLDHVVSNVALVRAIQRMLEPLWVHFHKDSLLRHPIEHVRAEGLEILWQERSKLGIVERVLARKPA